MTRLMASMLAFVLAVALSVSARADVMIAMAGPLTGPDAAFGEQYKIGAELAVRDINASGGLLGQQLELKFYDDACDPGQAVSVANKLVSEGAAMVVGHYCSHASIPASKVYEEDGIIQISPSTSNPKFTDEGGPNVFRVSGRDDQQGGVAGAYLAKNFADKNIAIIHDRSTFGKGLADETKKAMNQAGKQETLQDSYFKGDKDFSALVTKLKRNKIDVVYVGGYHEEAGLLVRQMRENGLDAILVGGDTLMTEHFAAITGDAGDGTLMTFPPDPRKNPAAVETVKRLRAKGVEPEGYVLYSYAAVQVWKQAVEKAGSLDSAKVIAALQSGEFDTVIGKFEFDKKGDPDLRPYAFYRWQDGSYAQIN